MSLETNTHRTMSSLFWLAVVMIGLSSACSCGDDDTGEEWDGSADGDISDADNYADVAESKDGGESEGGDSDMDATGDTGQKGDSGQDAKGSTGRPNCGNGELDEDEECDDGNDQDDDGCNRNCEVEACFHCVVVGSACEQCGNGIVESAEECDDGNCESGDGCNSSCDVEEDWVCPVAGQDCELCGNGVLEPNERCDDGNTDADDGCAEDCRSIEKYFVCLEAGQPCIECGDGEVDGNEVCDNGAQCSDGTDCTSDASVCDGIGDGSCAPRSGDGCVFNCIAVEPGWVCLETGGECSLCGDGVVSSATEECDDGNFQSGDGCSAACDIEAGATCMVAGVLCSVCGNGYIEYTSYLGDNGTPSDPSDDFADLEECDDGNQDDGDGCSSTCEQDSGWDCPVVGMGCGRCGDGIVQDIEICDDGRTCTDTDSGDLDGTDCTADDTACLADNGTCAPVSGDGCSDECVEIDPYFLCPPEGGDCTECGDGVLDTDLEGCDDGNVLSGDGCNRLCQVETNLPWVCITANQPCELCGNGVRETNEACDDGNTVSDDGCSADCQSIEDNYNCFFPGYACAICGDGAVDVGEECDEGHLATPENATDGCDEQCQVVYPWVCPLANAPCELCGDGVVDTIEMCDDSNTANGDGCSATCQVELGYDCSGVICVAAACGDGFVAGDEQCDDGNLMSGDGCSFVCDVEKGFSCSGSLGCHRTTCGDGIVEGEEECDDGSICTGGSEDGNSCTNDAATCETGGGSCAPVGSDGCDEECMLEIGYACPNSGQACIETRCGDGIVEGAEQCDVGGAICVSGTEDGLDCVELTDYENCIDGGGTCPAVDNIGCDTLCQLKSGYYCPDPGQTCVTTICGDGLVQGMEECDDGISLCSGGTEDGMDCTSDSSACIGGGGVCNPAPEALDGCDTDCIIEPFYRCTGEPSDCRPIIEFVSILRFAVENVNPAALNYNPDRRSFAGHKAQESQKSIELCLDGTVINQGDTTASAYGTIFYTDGSTAALPDDCSEEPTPDPCYRAPLRPDDLTSAEIGAVVGSTFDPVTGHFLYLFDHGSTITLYQLPRDIDPNNLPIGFDLINYQVEMTLLSVPGGLTVGENGDLYVPDDGTGRVVVFPRRRDGDLNPIWPDCQNTGMDSGGNCTSFQDTPDVLRGFFAPSDGNLDAVFTVPGERIIGLFNQYDGAEYTYTGTDLDPISGGTFNTNQYFTFFDIDSSEEPPQFGEPSAFPGLLFQLGNAGTSYTNDADSAETAPDGGYFIICVEANSEDCQMFARVCYDDSDCPPGTICNFDGVDTIGVNYCYAPGVARDDLFEVERDTDGSDTFNLLDVLANDSLSESACVDPTLRIVSVCDESIVQSDQAVCDSASINGQVTASDDGINYDAPDDGRCGFIDTISYTADLGGGVLDSATVRVIVACVCGDGTVDGNEQCDDGDSNGDPGYVIDDNDTPDPSDDVYARCSLNCLLNLYCGDRHIVSPEECDDGNTLTGDGCSSICTLESICGNGEVEGVEECDDGRQCQDGTDCTDDPADCMGIGDESCQTQGGDGCNTNCTIPVCGDGNVDLDNPAGAEQCDDGNTNPADDCTNECTVRTECGNGIIEPPLESCDDGNVQAGDGCSAQCTVENICGNNILDGSEVCDGDAYGSCPLLNSSQIMCINYYDGAPNICLCENYCGDSMIGDAEECDDGADGSEDCRGASPESGVPCSEIRCGDNVVDTGEQCDDGNTDPTDTCTNNCVWVTVCGNTTIEGDEECDDGNNVSGDGCSSACKDESAVCGDSVLHYTEQCDDGNLQNDDGCDENCMIESGECGDGTVDLGEECDDGNTESGDGCSSSCTSELCGNGILDSDEACDDGKDCANGTDCTENPSTCDGIGDGSCEQRSGDGCSITCTIEIL